MTPKCCGLDSIWVENVTNKGYFYCKECKKEVSEEAQIAQIIEEMNPDLFNLQVSYFPQQQVDQAVKETLRIRGHFRFTDILNQAMKYDPATGNFDF